MEIPIPDPKAPMWESWAKWVEMQQQFNSLIVAVKGAQKPCRNPYNMDQIRVRELTIKMPTTPARYPKDKGVSEIK